MVDDSNGFPHLPSASDATPSFLSDQLDELSEQGLLRRRVTVQRRLPGKIVVDGREYVDLSSNDYLGLAADPRVAEEVRQTLATHGWGAAASALVTGYHHLHEKLEEELAAFEGVRRVLLLGSGFAANVGVLGAVLEPQDVVFCDKRNHASLIDGCRLSGAKLRVYHTNRLDELERRLSDSAGYRRRWLVTDTVFSMDGDTAPLADLCAAAKRQNALVYADEAHATGVLGPRGRGCAEEMGVEQCVELRMGTLSKALGGVGAFIIGSGDWTDWLINKVRPYVYSTAPPPVCAAAASAALRLLQAEPERRRRVNDLAAVLRERLGSDGFDVGSSCTPIIPVKVGDPSLAVRWASELRSAGFWVTAIRPPTVPTGTSRLRLSISAAHAEADIERLAEELGKVKRSFPA